MLPACLPSSERRLRCALAFPPATPTLQTLCSLGSLAHGRDRGLFQAPSSEGPRVRSILLTLHEVAAALVFLHALGIVHGDLSPNNVLLECVLCAWSVCGGLG